MIQSVSDDSSHTSTRSVFSIRTAKTSSLYPEQLETEFEKYRYKLILKLKFVLKPNK